MSNLIIVETKTINRPRGSYGMAPGRFAELFPFSIVGEGAKDDNLYSRKTLEEAEELLKKLNSQ